MCASCICGPDPHPILGPRVTGLVVQWDNQVVMDPGGALIYVNTLFRVCPSPWRLGGGIYLK